MQFVDNQDGDMKFTGTQKNILGFIFVNEFGSCLMLDNHLNFYFGALDLESDYFSSDIVFFDNEVEASIWLGKEKENLSRRLQDGSKVNLSFLNNLKLCEISAKLNVNKD